MINVIIAYRHVIFQSVTEYFKRIRKIYGGPLLYKTVFLQKKSRLSNRRLFSISIGLFLTVLHQFFSALPQLFFRMQGDGCLLDGFLHPCGQGLKISIGFHILRKIGYHEKTPFQLRFYGSLCRLSYFYSCQCETGYYFIRERHII